MADKYLNLTDLTAIKQWIEGKFGLKSALETLEDRVDDIIAEGGEPNVIETVKVNGTALTPDANKAVDVTVPTAVSELTNDGDGTQGSAFATEDYVDQNGGKIDTISVNGTQQTITNKNVDITVPTDVSDLNDDVGIQTASDVSTAISTALANSGDAYQTESDVESAISTAVSSAYEYKGSVATQSVLPSSGQAVGDVWDTQDTGMNYAWNGTAWDALGTYVDTSVLWASTAGQSNSLIAATVAEVNAILEPSA